MMQRRIPNFLSPVIALFLIFFLQRSIGSEPFDRIVAIVDDQIVLLSDVEEFEAMYQSQLPPNQQGGVSSKEIILEKLIDEKVMLSIAKRDTELVISEKELEMAAEQRYASIVEQNGGESRLEMGLQQSTGMTLSEFKESIQSQTEEQLYKQKLMQNYVGQPTASNLQIKEFYKQYKDSLPVLNDNISVSHIEMSIKPSTKILSKAYKKADSLIQLLEKGHKFEALAKVFSDDPTGADGGDLGYTKRGLLDSDYERAAFRLKVGEYTTQPVRTKFGFHIIMLTAKRDVEIKTSHILIRTIPTRQDTVRTLALLDSLRKAAMKHNNFGDIALKYSEDKKTNKKNGLLGWYQHERLTDDYKAILDTLDEGQISAPSKINDRFHLFKVNKKLKVRNLSLEDDWLQISELAKNFNQGEKMKKLLKGWRKKVYIENRFNTPSPAPR